MGGKVIGAILGLLLAAAGAPAAMAAVTEEEAHAIGVDAYLYFYSPVTMDLTRKQLTNQEPTPGGIGGPMNRFANVGAFPTADMRVVVRPNFDTLYSSGWLDLTKEPMVVSAPDTGGRYYLLPMLDMWTDVFASPGWRTTGTGAGNFLVTPPGWRPDLREKFVEEFRLPDNTQRIDAPTPYVWIIGRTKTDGPADYDAVHKIQAGYKITPLSQWGKEPVPPEVKIDPSIDMKTPPKVQVDTMPAAKFFAYAAELLKLHPPHITDQPIIARLKRIGFEVGKSFDLDKADPAVQKGLASAPEDAQKLMAWKVPTLARIANGWSMNTDTMGVYGNYYLKRAIVTQFGLGANLPERRHLSAQPRRRHRQAARRREQLHHPFRQEPDAAGRSLLVDHALRSRRLPGCEHAQPLRGVELDAVQIQSRRLARSLFPEREPWRRQGSELAAGAEGPVQAHHAPLRAEERGAHRQMESAAGDESGDRADRGPVVASGWHRIALS